MNQNIVPYQPKEITPAVETFSSQLTSYLDSLGLPKEKVLVSMEQRRAVINNMDTVIEGLSEEQRTEAMYVSKFIAACAVGLFDAALNFLWNETVRNLREKAARFDLEYFFDSVVTDPDRRSKLRTEVDLEKLDDWELIRGCQSTGLITDFAFKHLDYIRDMRNWASAAHPNQNELTGLQVMSWLETCIREVLSKEPSGPVIEVRKLIHSLRQEKLSDEDVTPIAATLPLLPDDLSRSLLRTLVGMYTSLALSADVRNNIKLIAKSVWEVCTDDARHETGLKFASLEANGEVTRAKLAREFLEVVGGLTFLPADRLELEISGALDMLKTAHNGYDNFYNEAAPAKMLQRLVPASGQVPTSVAKKYVKTLTMCRIGNGYGVSWAAQPIYDDLIGRFSDMHRVWFAQLPNDVEVASRLQFKSCGEQYRNLAKELEQKAANERLKQALGFIAGYPPAQLNEMASDGRFQQTLRSIAAKA